VADPALLLQAESRSPGSPGLSVLQPGFGAGYPERRVLGLRAGTAV